MSDELLDKMRDGLRKVQAHAEFLKEVGEIYREGAAQLLDLQHADLVVGQPNEPDGWSYATGQLEVRALVQGDEEFDRLFGRAGVVREWAGDEDERGACATHPCFPLAQNDTHTSADPILQALAHGEVIIPGGRLVAAAFLDGLLGVELDHPRNWLRIAYLRQGWDQGLAREKVDAFLQYVKERPLLFFYGWGWMPPRGLVDKWRRTDEAEVPSWAKFPEHLQRQRTTLRAQIKKAPDLFTSATAAEVEEREKLMVQYLRENKEVQAVEVEMHMTPEESAVHRLLVERFSQFGYPLQVELTPGEILDGCGLPETPDNYRRIREAIHRLVTEPRLRAYRHAIDADKAPKRAWGKDPKKPRKEQKDTFVNIGPLWDITNVYAVGSERVTQYKVRPMGELFHQVNELHQGRPAYYRWELLQLMPKLSQDLGSLSDAAQAEKLLTAIRNNIYPKGKWAQAAPGVIDPDGWLVFDYKDTARVLQLPTQGKPPTRAPRDEREEGIRERIQGLVAHGLRDKEIAENLSANMGEAITRAEAKKLRERLVGGSLAPKEPTEPRKLRPKLEKLLKALQGTHPEFLLEWTLPERGPRWSVRIAAQWTPSSKVATPATPTK